MKPCGTGRKLAPLLSEILRKRRYGTVGASWYVDETYGRVDGRWQYLYRALDREGNLVDVRLSDTRDLAAAEVFFRAAWTGTGVTPHRITTDGHDAYPRALRTVFGEEVTHRTNRYLNNHLEQDHRGITPGIGRWAGSNTVPRLRAPAACSTRYGRFSAPSLAAINPSPFGSAEPFIRSDSAN